MLKSSIIRVFAFAALFAYIIPTVFGVVGFGSNFAFTGSIFAAFGVGVAFVAATFVMLGLIGLGSAPFKLSIEKRVSLAPLWATLFVIFSTLCLLGVGSLLPSLGLTVTGLLPALIGSGAALAVMHLTLPAKVASSTPTK